nr:hypothetical protein B0A51_05396 [Rachicladosporium sp. CCFEE 5018]
MRFSTSIIGLLALPFALAGDAPVVTNNVVGVSYIATLPDRNNTSVRGAMIVNTNSNATSANVQVSISGLPTYHIHEFPVAPDHNCSSTGAHLDPYAATESPPCDPAQEQKCQVGDLAGKHGKMSGPSYSGNYADLYLSTTPDTPAFVGNRSIVVHYANKTRITCANFTIQGTFSNGAAPSPHASASSRPVSSADGSGQSPTGSVISGVSSTTLPPKDQGSPTNTQNLGVVVSSTVPVGSGQAGVSGVTATLPGASSTSPASPFVEIITISKTVTPKPAVASGSPTLAVVVMSTILLANVSSSVPGSTITMSPSTVPTAVVITTVSEEVVTRTVPIGSGATAPSGSTIYSTVSHPGHSSTNSPSVVTSTVTVPVETLVKIVSPSSPSSIPASTITQYTTLPTSTVVETTTVTVSPVTLTITSTSQVPTVVVTTITMTDVHPSTSEVTERHTSTLTSSGSVPTTSELTSTYTITPKAAASGWTSTITGTNSNGPTASGWTSTITGSGTGGIITSILSEVQTSVVPEVTSTVLPITSTLAPVTSALAPIVEALPMADAPPADAPPADAPSADDPPPADDPPADDPPADDPPAADDPPPADDPPAADAKLRARADTNTPVGPTTILSTSYQSTTTMTSTKGAVSSMSQSVTTTVVSVTPLTTSTTTAFKAAATGALRVGGSVLGGLVGVAGVGWAVL